jgi:hypothetical protein
MSFRDVIAQAPAEQTEQRLATCRACEHHGVVPVVNTEVCKVCGCPLLNKTKFLNSTCPQGKW